MNDDTNLPDLAITSIAFMIWGSSYIITTEFLPPDHPVFISLMRALPAGLLLLAIVRKLPTGVWWLRVAILATLNFSFFFIMLFISAYRLPGGVAATVGSIQPLAAMVIARFALGFRIRPLAVAACAAGAFGVALLVLGPGAKFDMIGVIAALAGALSMATGVVLSRYWQPPVSSLTFTAWQLTMGGLILVPLTFMLEPPVAMLTARNIGGFLYLGLVGTVLPYFLLFRGISRINPAAVSLLGVLSPTVATLLGWVFLDQALSGIKLLGMAIVFASVVMGQFAMVAPAKKAIPA
jgi:probable blue pigment (indigoidine) exporter